MTSTYLGPVRRSLKLRVAVTPAEKKYIEDLARSRHESVSEVIRQAVLPEQEEPQDFDYGY